MFKDSQQRIKSYLATRSDIEFAVLVGSRANGQAHERSDWDIAVRWRIPDKHQASPESIAERLANIEQLRQMLSELLATTADEIDLIDVCASKLAMREQIANHGLVLAGEDNIVWLRFLEKTWRELEDYYWDDIYVA